MRRRPFLWAIAGGAGGLLAVLLVVLLVNTWALAGAIRDCTASDGDCYHQQLRQRREIALTTRQIVVAAAECSVLVTTHAPAGAPPDEQLIQTCVERKLGVPHLHLIDPRR